jgi:outer membrane immunogenic protein
MKKILAAVAAATFAGVAGAANAADVYPGSLKDVPVAPPLWTGLYFGVHVGGIWADVSNHLNDYPYDGTGLGWNSSNSNVFAGGQFGYNYQVGAFVIGVETDFGGAGINDGWHNVAPSLSARNDDGVYADITGRLGYTAGSSLFYVKGGWAYFDSDAKLTGYTGTAASEGLGGWTIGAGIEYAFAPNWSVKAEYLYFDFSQNATNWTLPNGSTYSFDRDITVNSFKVGLNYRVGSLFTPLK